MLTLASMIETKSVVSCQLGFRATWDRTNQMVCLFGQHLHSRQCLSCPAWVWNGCMSWVKDSLGKDLPAQQILPIVESKRHFTHNWQFGKGRLLNKVVSFARLLVNAKHSLEITEAAVIQDWYGQLRFGVCISFKSGWSPTGLTGNRMTRKRGEQSLVPGSAATETEKHKPGLPARCW